MPAPLHAAKMTAENKETMREWAAVNGKAVSQGTARQETTMAKAGTLPASSYHQELQPTDSNEDIECNSDDPGNNENENLEYDTDDSLEDCLDNFDKEVEISKKATFLVGRTLRFGRAVKFDNKCF